jgi:formate dehydrogenase iron-sulfur subunit
MPSISKSALGAGAYICGEETSLLESLEGKRAHRAGQAAAAGAAGLFGKPTVVNNVLSFAAVPWILHMARKAYADYGMGRSRGTMPVQLGGNIKRGGLIELAFGISLREIIEDIGGGTLSGRPIRAVQVGGPLGAYLTAAQLRRCHGLRGARRHDGDARPWRHRGLRRHRRHGQAGALRLRILRQGICGKCTPCRIGATRGVEVMDRIIAGTERPKNIAVLRDLNTDDRRLALRHGRLHADAGDERAEPFFRGFRPAASLLWPPNEEPPMSLIKEIDFGTPIRIAEKRSR